MHRYLLAALFLTGCPGFGNETLADRVGLDTVPTYEVDVRPLLKMRCLGCHGEQTAGGAPNSFHTYELAVQTADRINARAVQQQNMPPGQGLSDPMERAILEAWISGGTPRGMPLADMTPPDMGAVDQGGIAPTWDGEIGDILITRCGFAGCHGGAAPAAGLDLSGFSGFEAGGNSGDLRGERDPSTSLLVDRLRAREGALMPAGGPALPEAQIQAIEAWIVAGCPEN